MDAGLTGRPAIFRSQTCDMLDPSGFFVAYAQFSGGIFIDCSIHDIDLALWFFGQDSIVKSVVSSGITAVQPNLRKYGDRDNAVGIVEFYGRRIAYLYCSRMMAAGQEDSTEIIGTGGQTDRQRAAHGEPGPHLRSFGHPARDPAELLRPLRTGLCERGQRVHACVFGGRSAADEVVRRGAGGQDRLCVAGEFEERRQDLL